jgi:hypothetical protein
MPASNKALSIATALAAGALLLAGPTARAAVLYEQTFDLPDAGFPSGTSATLASVVDGGGGNGALAFNDTDGGKKAYLSVLQTFDQPVMTFSFDVVAPVVRGNDGAASNELILRADGGTGTSIAGSGTTVIELILFRDGNRTGYQNTGNESAYIVANNDDANSLTFTSPVDNATSITLAANQYAAFVRDNGTGAYTQAKGPTNFGSGAPVLTHFAIGNASNAYLGTSSIDNVRVVDSVAFAVPEPASLSLLAVPAAAFLRRRRTASRD